LVSSQLLNNVARRTAVGHALDLVQKCPGDRLKCSGSTPHQRMIAGVAEKDLAVGDLLGHVAHLNSNIRQGGIAQAGREQDWTGDRGQPPRKPIELPIGPAQQERAVCIHHRLPIVAVGVLPKGDLIWRALLSRGQRSTQLSAITARTRDG